jgi:hypothetical protein
MIVQANHHDTYISTAKQAPTANSHSSFGRRLIRKSVYFMSGVLTIRDLISERRDCLQGIGRKSEFPNHPNDRPNQWPVPKKLSPFDFFHLSSG